MSGQDKPKVHGCFFCEVSLLPHLSYFNSNGVSFSSAFLVRLQKAGGITVTVGEAVKKRILQLCAENDLSINKLCTISGVTQSTVNNIVSGRNNSATVATVKKLCDGLEMSVRDFFDDPLFDSCCFAHKLRKPFTQSAKKKKRLSGPFKTS